MSKLISIVSAAAMAALTALVVSAAAQAQSQAESWPQRPVRFIVGLGPGSAQDIAARLFGDQLSKRWGQPVVIENKPGADGIVAINAFTGAHDPHTLLFAASGTFTAHPTQYAKLPYDPSDLVPLARVSSTIIAVSVPTALNVNTLDELVALARKEPGKLNLVPTPGTTEITFDNFLKTAGVTMTKIPYSDVTKALADLAENRVQVMVSGIAIADPLVRPLGPRSRGVYPRASRRRCRGALAPARAARVSLCLIVEEGRSLGRGTFGSCGPVDPPRFAAMIPPACPCGGIGRRA